MEAFFGFLFFLISVCGLVSLIIGLCSHRFITAFIWSVVISALISSLLVAPVIVISMGSHYSNTTLLYIVKVAASILLSMGLLGFLGHAIRRGFGALLRISSKPQSPESSK